MPNMIPQRAAPSPRHIAAGLGDASRQEICGLLAILDAARLTKVAGAMGEAARRRLVSDDKPSADRVTVFAKELMDGSVPTDALRARLWLSVKRSLGLPELYLLSTRGLEEEAAAIAVRASEILAPAVTSAQQQKADADLSIMSWTGRKLLRSATGAFRQSRAAVTFPDVVAHELTATMEGIAEAESRDDLDPEVAAAIRKGQHAISAAVLAGVGWAALATAIGSAGFAPYIAAAKLSAVIPFLTGPTLTSLLFVMINPVGTPLTLRKTGSFEDSPLHLCPRVREVCFIPFGVLPGACASHTLRVAAQQRGPIARGRLGRRLHGTECRFDAFSQHHNPHHKGDRYAHE